MQKFIAVVRFHDPDDEVSYRKPSAAKKYEYFLPETFTNEDFVAKDARADFAVVCTNGVAKKASDFKIVPILEIKVAEKQHYEGDLKPVVAHFSADGFLRWAERLQQKKALLARMHRKVAELGVVQQLQALASQDPEAAAMLEEFRKQGGAL